MAMTMIIAGFPLFQSYNIDGLFPGCWHVFPGYFQRWKEPYKILTVVFETNATLVWQLPKTYAK